MTIVEIPNNYMFTTPPISADKSSQCISNLKPNTGYSITVMAVFNCANASDAKDFTTLPAVSSDDSPSTQDCIKYDPVQTQNGNDLQVLNLSVRVDK